MLVRADVHDVNAPLVVVDLRWDPVVVGLASREDALASTPSGRPWRVMERDGDAYRVTDQHDPTPSSARVAVRPASLRRAPPASDPAIRQAGSPARGAGEGGDGAPPGSSAGGGDGVAAGDGVTAGEGSPPDDPDGSPRTLARG